MEEYATELQRLIETQLGHKIYLITPANDWRHIVVRIRGGDPTYWCLVRRQGAFRTFWKFFSSLVGTMGESINRTELDKAVRLSSTLIFSYPPGEEWKHYQILAKDFRDNAETHNWIRTQYGGELTYCIPFDLLEPIPSPHLRQSTLDPSD